MTLLNILIFHLLHLTLFSFLLFPLLPRLLLVLLYTIILWRLFSEGLFLPLLIFYPRFLLPSLSFLFFHFQILSHRRPSIKPIFPLEPTFQPQQTSLRSVLSLITLGMHTLSFSPLNNKILQMLQILLPLIARNGNVLPRSKSTPPPPSFFTSHEMVRTITYLLHFCFRLLRLVSTDPTHCFPLQLWFPRYCLVLFSLCVT